VATKFLRLLPVLALLVIPVAASAQIDNGDFEQGGAGWAINAPPDWMIDFPNTGGNPEGYAQIHSPFGNSGGTGCITQIFDCGIENGVDLCEISFDFRSENWDANSEAGRVQVFIDGVLEFQAPESDKIDWKHVTIEVPCGRHQIDLCLNVDDGNNGWIACFDNVTAECMTPVQTLPGTWGEMKDLYR
jgi:hypothetical protein